LSTLTRNPLLVAPPKHKYAKPNRAGSGHTQDIVKWVNSTEYTTTSAYEGVHVSADVFAAAAYALLGMVVNDYEIVDSPVLIGIDAKKVENDIDIKDLDVLTLAQGFHEFLEKYEGLEIEDLEDDQIIEEEAQELSSVGLDLGEMGLSGVLGSLANRPPKEDARSAIYDLLHRRDKGLPIDKQYLIVVASQLVPQARIMRDVPISEVVQVRALAPFRPFGEDGNLRSFFDFPFNEKLPDLPEGSSYENDTSLKEYQQVLNKFILDNSTKIHGSKRRSGLLWHGTTSSRLHAAFPQISESSAIDASWKLRQR
jgi:hypothetical protein